jgi:hypothetical protein
MNAEKEWDIERLSENITTFFKIVKMKKIGEYAGLYAKKNLDLCLKREN